MSCTGRLYVAAFTAALLLLCAAVPAHADRAQLVARKPPKNALPQLSIFDRSMDATKILGITDVTGFQTIELKDSTKKAPSKNGAITKPAEETLDLNDPRARGKLEFVSDDPTKNPVLPPDQTPSVRVNPDAPGSIKGMISAMRMGDQEMAMAYAGQHIRYMQNYFFEVREIVQLLGEAMVKEGVINEDNWVGVGQAMEYEFAKSRHEMNAVIKPTHDVAMTRIKPDPKKQIEILYFFSFNCSWCRYMGPDIERLWQMVKDDPNVKMTALTIGDFPEAWLPEYRSYTGLTMPVLNGGAVARELGIAFVPAVVILAPNSKQAYLKSGQQNFERLYEFARTVQGLPAVVTERFQEVASTPIGEAELKHAATKLAKNGVHRKGRSFERRTVSAVRTKDSMERF